MQQLEKMTYETSQRFKLLEHNRNVILNFIYQIDKEIENPIVVEGYTYEEKVDILTQQKVKCNELLSQMDKYKEELSTIFKEHNLEIIPKLAETLNTIFD